MQIEAYCNALVSEIKAYAKDHAHEYRVETIFLGGDAGFLSQSQFTKVCCSIFESFTIAKNCEITMEVQPKSVSIAKLKCWKKLGVNRLSIAFLSLNEVVLRILGGTHSARHSVYATMTAEKYGFKNINLDIAFDVPVPRDMAKAGLFRELKLELSTILSALPFVNHISVYAVMPEEGTEIMRRLDYEELYELTEESSIQEELVVSEVLRIHGFERYEVTSWAKPGFVCRHNKVYWTAMKEYIGFGMGAASLFKGERFENTEDLNMYLLNPNKVSYRHTRTKKDIINEVLMMGLRTKEGVRLDLLSELGYELMQERARDIIELQEHNLIKLTKTTIKATKEGMMILNMLIDRLHIKEKEQIKSDK